MSGQESAPSSATISLSVVNEPLPTMSMEPPPRLSLDDPSSGLVTQFDLYLKVIADRYLGFFLERSANHNPTIFSQLILLFVDAGLKRPSALFARQEPPHFG
jgi:hypothetical protein